MDKIDILDAITAWPKAKESPVDIKIGEVDWSWIFHSHEWCITCGATMYDESSWKDYTKDKEYVSPAPNIFDVINYWPQAHKQCLGTKDLPEGWSWQWVNDDWFLSNGIIGLVRDDWFKYRDEMVAAQQATPLVTAASMLQAALGHMEDRAKTYDTPGGERSMGKTVSAFNTIIGLTLSEEQGWLFMEILKQVRSQQGNYRADNYEDMVAYAALRGECAARERGDE
jgi:hypothetical protein